MGGGVMPEPTLASSGAGRGSLASYGAGFILSVLLTAAAFGFVVYAPLSHTATVAAIFTAAVAQMWVHLHYFLHLNASSRARWNVLALVMALLIMLLFVAGSLWIMAHLHYRLG